MLPIQVDPLILRFAAALCIGLLIGVERERRKGEGSSRAAAGVRTFALAALLGALAKAEGGSLGLAVAAAAAAVFATASYLVSRADDPGLTTETALVLTVLLGGLAAERPSFAGALGVIVVVLLAARSPLHRFVRVLSETELRDGLVFAVVTFVIWPLLPDRAVGPFDALNLHSIWLVVILVMAIGAAGRVAVRLVGARFGIPLVGFVSGFVSSAVTIAAMGARAANNPAMLNAAVAGAVLSTIATLVQLGLLLSAVDADVLRVLARPLICAVAAALVYAAAFLGAALRAPASDGEQSGRAFSLGAALGLAALLCGVLVASAALAHWLGANGVLMGAVVSGFIDVHAASVSIAALAAGGKISAVSAAVPILAALSANTITKAFFALSSGSGRFVARVTPGLVLVAAAAWFGLLVLH